MSVTRIRVVTFSRGLPLMAAMHLGLLEQVGLTIEWRRTRGSIEQVRGLLDGESDIIHTAADNVMAYRDRENADLFLFFVGDLRIEQELIVRPDVRSYADLRGQRLGADAPDTGYAIVLRRMLAMNGVAEGEYDLVPLGGTEQRLAGLREGRIAGCMLQRPGEADLAGGLHVLDEARRHFPNYPGLTAATTRRWAAEHGDALSAYTRALVLGGRWAIDPTNRETAAGLLAEDLGVDATDAARRLDSAAAPPSVEDAEIGLRVVRKLRDDVLHERPTAASDDLSSYWDPRYQRAAL